MAYSPNINLHKVISLFTLLFAIQGFAQVFNSEVAAQIKIEKNSEFYTFKATVENKTSSDFNLRCDFLVFTTQDNGEVKKDNQSQRFFIQANTKKIVSSLTVQYYVTNKVIIVLLVYDQDNKPIGKDRIVLENGGKTDLNLNERINTNIPISQDQSRPDSGLSIRGLVIENALTKSGRDFYRYFYSLFYNLQVITSKNIEIKEIIARGRNTRISVYVEKTLVWQFFAQPRKEYLKEMAKIAVDRSIRRIQQLEKQRNTYN